MCNTFFLLSSINPTMSFIDLIEIAVQWCNTIPVSNDVRSDNNSRNKLHIEFHRNIDHFQIKPTVYMYLIILKFLL